MAKQGTKKKGALPEGAKALLRNRRASHDYELSDFLEAGLVLQGSEVKSLRDARGSIQEAYVQLKNGEVWLVGATIREYPWANQFNHSPTRERKLLLNADEIRKISIRVEQRGFTIVPIQLYLKKGRIKLQIALGKGKKEFEKRQSQKSADDKREIDRALKDHR
ncbi:MAG: SsrA-binding protein SmpB [Myxococcales bacterium]|nr:SsrA-binding protein SmpB [Myxococcales bacterium]